MAWIESQGSAQNLVSMTAGESKAGLVDDVQVCGNLDQHFPRESAWRVAGVRRIGVRVTG